MGCHINLASATSFSLHSEKLKNLISDNIYCFTNEHYKNVFYVYTDIEFNLKQR